MDGSSTQTNANNALDLNNLTLEIEHLNAEMTRQRDQMAAMLNADRALNIEVANEILMNEAENNNQGRNNIPQALPINNNANRPRANNVVPLIIAIANIHDFSGQPQTLLAFAKLLKDIVRNYGQDCEQFLLNSIPRRLKGRAYEAYAGVAPSYNRLDDFYKT